MGSANAGRMAEKRTTSRTARPPAAATAASAATAAAESAPAPARLRPRLIHGEVTPAELLVVQRADRFLRVVVGRHVDEGESARPSRRHVAHDVDGLDRARAAEQVLQILLGHRVREVSDVELFRHSVSLSFAPRRGAFRQVT